MTVTTGPRALPAPPAAVPPDSADAAGGEAAPTLFDGSYTVDLGRADTGTWTVTSTGATDGCTAHITSAAGWTGVATLTDGRWVMVVDNPRGSVRVRADGEPDGRAFPTTQRWSLDAVTLAGTVGAEQTPASCGETGWHECRVTLSRVG